MQVNGRKEAVQASRTNGGTVGIWTESSPKEKKIQDSLAKRKQANEFVDIILKKYKDHRGPLTSVEGLNRFIKNCSDQNGKDNYTKYNLKR